MPSIPGSPLRMDKAWLSSNISCVIERADVSGPEWTHVLVNEEDHRAGAACTFMVPLGPLVYRV